MGNEGKRRARERLAERRRLEAARARRKRTLLISGAAVVAIVVIVAVVFVVQRSRDDSADTGGYSGPLAPIAVDTSAATATMTKPGVTKPLVDVYEDFQCPHCKRFEESTGSVLRQLAAQSKIKVVYHLVGFVNPIGSPRAAAAALCVPSSSWMKYHDALFARQPAESNDPRQSAFTADRLRAIGADIGLDDKTLKCIADQKYAGQARKATETATKVDHVDSTPVVRRDGRDIPLETAFDREAFTKALTG